MKNLSWLLAPAAMLYGLAVGLRNRLFDCGLLRQRRFGVPVICVGNLAVGGTGKTPHVEHILRLLHEHGFRVAMLSRGYGRRTSGFRLAGPGDTAREIGDEPQQILKNCSFASVAVCEDRCAGIERLLDAAAPPDVIVLDDAMQHRYVKPGLTLLLTDSRRLYSSDHLLPWGRLREPRRGAARADAVVVTKCSPGNLPGVPVLPHQRLFHTGLAYTEPYPLFPGDYVASGSETIPAVHGADVLVVTGIAVPGPLYEHLSGLVPRRFVKLSYPDHHVFSPADVAAVNRAFASFPGDVPRLAVTTEKDAARLRLCGGFDPELRRAFYVLPVRLEMLGGHPEKPTLNQIILNYVRENQRNSPLD